jgi:AraC-like DNA-binding protein
VDAELVAEPAHLTSNHGRLGAIVDRCQTLAGRVGEVPPATLLLELDSFVADLPTSLGRFECALLTVFLAQLLARLVDAAGLSNHRDVASGFFKLAHAGSTIDVWRESWFSATACCLMLLPAGTNAPLQGVDARVTRMLQVIHARYANPKLTMRTVAQTVHLCPSHAARLLKQYTGDGFFVHLHQRRLAAARQLLAETSLGVKGIAAMVGYAHASQLSRHFKRMSGETPLAFRGQTVTPRLSA